MKRLACAALVIVDCGGRIASDAMGPTPDASWTPDAAVDATIEASIVEAGVGDTAILDADILDVVDGSPCGSAQHLSHGVCLADDVATDLPTIDECVDAGTVLWVDGDPGAYILTGTSDLVGGWWAVSSESYGQLDNGALLEAHYANSSWTDPWWFLLFRDSNTLMTGVVYHASSSQNSNAGLKIQLGGNGCYAGATLGENPGEGAFRIDDFDANDAGALYSLSGAFWILCDKASGVLRGCVRYAQ